MPLRKIYELQPISVCRNPEHDPPTMIHLEPGVYEHTCPGCGRVVRFVVPEGPSFRSPLWKATSTYVRGIPIGSTTIGKVEL